MLHRPCDASLAVWHKSLLVCSVRTHTHPTSSAHTPPLHTSRHEPPPGNLKPPTNPHVPFALLTPSELRLSMASERSLAPILGDSLTQVCQGALLLASCFSTSACLALSVLSPPCPTPPPPPTHFLFALLRAHVQATTKSLTMTCYGGVRLVVVP
jgi:hypothetical protein